MITIRAEEPPDYPQIFQINRRAFDTDVEARLVNTLRDQARFIISLVAELDGKVVGHILFSPVTIKRGQKKQKAMGLGPMAVLPELQRRGIGSKLVESGLKVCRNIGENVVFVLGHPEYYAKFGFQLAAPKGLQYKSADFEPYFFVIELEPGALANISGMVSYHPAFDNV